MRFSGEIFLFLLLGRFDHGCSWSQLFDEIRRFDGDKVIQVVPDDREQVNFLKQLSYSQSMQIDFWRPPSQPGQPVDIHVEAESARDFERMLTSTDMPYRVIVNNVQRIIEQANQENQILSLLARSRQSSSGDLVGTFPRTQPLYDWLNSVCDKYSEIAKCGIVGRSYEGRPIMYIKIGKDAGLATKKIVFLEGTMHAREWLSTATIVYLINKVLTEHARNDDVDEVLNLIDFIFIPISNPDGYEYSHTTDRMWRKNRRPTTDKRCFGVDLNRNWDFKWGASGTSFDPCDEQTYGGPGPFSEKETQAISKFIAARRANLLAYFSIHAYMPAWLVPYGVTGSKPANFREMLRVATLGTRAMNNDTNALGLEHWEVGNTVDVLRYGASGGSEDWVKWALHAPYAYCLELRPGSNKGGFIALPSDIEPSGREVWEGLRVAIREMKIV